MMYHRLRYRIHTIVRKNKDDFLSLFLGKYPGFVYRELGTLAPGEIPIFVFHSVRPEPFERAIAFLSENKYRSLTATELHDVITGKKEPPINSIGLTFDDGRGSVWTTAFPILKKYGMKAICFLLPYWIEDSFDGYPTLDDYWLGKTGFEQIERREDIKPLCSWNEISHMHKSGVLDFQSHTSYHHTVFTSSRLVDFINPLFKPSFLSSDFNPVIRANGKDTFPHVLDWGLPVYAYRPSMASERRYVENDRLSQVCAEWVRQNGGSSFFNVRNWRRELSAFYHSSLKKYPLSRKYQTPAERFCEIYNDLCYSKRVIEERLKKSVTHVCFPWYSGSDFAVNAARDAGFHCIHWGIKGRRAVNRVVQNPYYLTRMNEEYLFTLPGKNRISVMKVLSRKIINRTHTR